MWPAIIGMLSSFGLGSALSKDSGSKIGAPFGFEIGTKKELYETQITNQNSYTYAPQTTTTYSPTETFAPSYSFNPQQNIGSDYSSITKKEASSLQIEPALDISDILQPSTSQSASQEMSGSSSNILDSIKQYAVLGGIGFFVYMLIKKKK